MPADLSVTPTEKTASRPIWRKVKWLLLAVAMVAVVGVTIFFVWGSRRYQELIHAGQKAQEQYGTLNKTFAFPAPGPGATAAETRWAAMMRVRQRLLASLDPEARRTLNGLANEKAVDRLGLALRLAPLADNLDRLIETHTAALRAEQMSPTEYQWLIGVAVYSAMAAPERYAAGAGYWRILRQVEQFSRANQSGADDVDAQNVFQLLGREVGASRAEPAVLDNLKAPDEAAYAIDVLAMASRWVSQTGLKPGGLPGK